MRAIKKALIYVRCSTTREQSTGAQIEELKRYCDARKFAVAHVISDEGISGTTDRRPGFLRMMELARKRENVDVVCVTKIDRLFRNLKHLILTLEELNELGVEFVSRGDAIDYTTPQGKALAAMLGIFASLERSLIVERTKMGLEHARRKGKILGRPRLSDFINSRILQLRAEGKTYWEIQKELSVSKGAISRAISHAPLTVHNINGQEPR